MGENSNAGDGRGRLVRSSRLLQFWKHVPFWPLRGWSQWASPTLSAQPEGEAWCGWRRRRHRDPAPGRVWVLSPSLVPSTGGSSFSSSAPRLSPRCGNGSSRAGPGAPRAPGVVTRTPRGGLARLLCFSTSLWLSVQTGPSPGRSCNCSCDR